MNYKIIVILAVVAVFVSGCAPTGQIANEAPVGNNTASSSQAVKAKCGLENCHGLDFTCGPNVPDACTQEYRLGDFCRQYAICEVIDNKCQLVPGMGLDECRTCVNKCLGLEPQAASSCETDCRNKMKQQTESAK